MDAELQKLKDIHLPPIIPMWSLIVGCIILCLVILGWVYIWRQQRKKKYTVKFALLQLKKLQAEDPSESNIAAEISQLIRRTALHYFNRNEIAGLSGTAWLNFLNTSGNTTQFTESVGQLLIEAPYRKSYTTDLAPLFTLTEKWLMTMSKKTKKWEDK